MGKTNNISPDSYQIYLMELFIANQKKILEQQDRIEQQNKERFDRIEAYMGMSDREKNKHDNFYTTKEAMEILRVSRNTLLNYRKNGILDPANPGKKVLYTAEEINRIKEYKNKTA